MLVPSVNVTKDADSPSSLANSSSLNVNYVELYVCAHLSKRENTMLLEEQSSTVVIATNRKKLRCWDVLAGICRKMNCQLWLTLVMKGSSFMQSFAFPKSAACSRYISIRPRKNRHPSDEQT